MINRMDDIDAQQAREQFQHDYRKCEGCGLESWHDTAYVPMRVAWRNLCYTCKIAGEISLLKTKRDTALKGE
jgi:hypothetical protein